MTTAIALPPSSDLYQQQLDLEEEMTQQGVQRFRAAIAKAQEDSREEATVYGNAILSGFISKVAAGIDEFVAQREAGGAGRKGPAYKYIKAFGEDRDTMAFIALRFVVSGMSKVNASATSLAGMVGRAIEDEFRYRAVREQDRKFYTRLQEEAAKRHALRVKRTVVNHFVGRRDFDLPDQWPEKDVVLVGMLLIEIVARATGLFTTEVLKVRSNESRTVIVPTEAARQFMRDRVATAEVMRPLYEPMIVPPVDWTGPFGGGYMTRRVRPLRLVKAFNRQYLASLEAQDLSEVCAAVNAAQQTAWAINPFILTVLEMAWEKDFSMGGIPHNFDQPLPPKPHDIETNEEARKAWRTEAHQVHLENLEMGSKRATFTTALNIATRYSLFEAIYFPYQLDFRGRIYAAPMLNPQGPDWMKALLQFSEGHPIDEESSAFLAIQVANTGAFNKIDKAPLAERVQWVYDNEEAILAVADSPFENRWWTEADSPYCFLAACREWAGWLREGVGFVSHLPVALDGSCSGIQHFSMALADEVGGAAVNLVPSEKPADIYTLVLNKVIERCKADAAGSDEKVKDVAAAWLRSGLLKRNCVKRPTMTYGYGSNAFGFREQLFTDTLKPAHKAHKRGEGEWFFEGDGFGAAVYLAGVILAAVEATVLKAAEAMAWLKDVARVVSAEGLPVRWTTPDGFLVVQNYREANTHRIDTVMFGSRVTMQVLTDTQQVDKRKQASGFPPNFVHSLDATHLRLTVRRAREEGITDFALVHDSFGTHAAKTGRFFALLRETMVEMYKSRDMMMRLYAEVAAQIEPSRVKDLPLPPALGTLEIEAVVESDFAFA